MLRRKYKLRLYSQKKGQAVVETALLGLILVMLLAAAVDFGRAYFTAVVVTNMAGEGAAYAAIFPERDAGCGGPATNDVSIKERARRIAIDRGLVIERNDQLLANITVTTFDRATSTETAACSARLDGEMITVKVSYNLDDLFLPGIVGFQDLTITKQASQRITSDKIGACTNPAVCP